MEWSDSGVVLGVRRHGETSVILETMTPSHGRHLGLVRGGRSRRLRPVLQPGNTVSLVWRARLDEHLGQFQVEPLRFRAASIMESAAGLYGVQAMAALLRLLPERDPHPRLHEVFDAIVDCLDCPTEAGELLVRFELLMLEELGFGLDLSRCAATGVTQDLVYISPKSGRAVSRDAGAPYAEKMLPLPSFLIRRENRPADAASLSEAFAITGYFLHRDVFGARGIEPSTARASFIDTIVRQVANPALRDESASSRFSVPLP